MKNIITLICLLVFSFNCIAQDTTVDSVTVTKPVLEGFWGIKFGSSPQVVRNAMLKKQGFTFNTESTNELMLYGSGTFAGNEAEDLVFSFVDNKLNMVLLHFIPSFPSKILDLYHEISDGITKKYFEPDVDREDYSYPFEKDDGYFETAIQQGKATIGSAWNFDSPNHKDFYNKIVVLVSSSMKVSLIYQDGYLCDLKNKREEEKNSSDY